MTEYERGLLTAAVEARRRAEEYYAEANKLAFAHYANRQKGNRARGDLLYEFAEWCEREANTYPGASTVLLGR